jgi:ATP-dependent Clp protease ATP-binding subunit ClpA
VHRFDAAAANALELAVTEAQALGHNYIGCEHLLLGLVAEPEGIAGQLLRARGAEPRLTRRAVAAALAGYVHLRAQGQGGGQGGGQEAAPAPGQNAAAAMKTALESVAALVRQELEPLTQRIVRLEHHLGLAAGGDGESAR